MPRRIRVEEVGYYHIVNRGVERRDVFLCDDDKDKFIEIVDESASLYYFVIHSYCLMDNHYHLLLETKKKNLSLLMRQVNSRYSIYFLKPDQVESFNLSSPQAIAAMKVNTLFICAKYRDYYDLYFLVKELFTLRDIYTYSKDIVEGISFKLFAVALVYIDDIEDDNIFHLDPKEDIAKEAIRDFFEQHIRGY